MRAFFYRNLICCSINMKKNSEEDIYMPVSGIGSSSQNYVVSSTPANERNQTCSSFTLTGNIQKVQQSEYRHGRGHQRQNAVDLRVETSITSIGFGNPVLRSATTLVDKLGSGTKINPQY
ncbi:hypothetical protein EHW66_00375 [Erwinia psidii]|uniref:hypothetical protein n=1 Tax=Erwinia psidii TaxID=69224 RepID=UPI00226BB13A|nr:hypothetical protein [Erwinia psidii]MCX8963520.1 hypothetical protein [Erwinia psidii]